MFDVCPLRRKPAYIGMMKTQEAGVGLGGGEAAAFLAHCTEI